MTQEVHVLADEEQMSAERTMQYDEKHTGIRTEKKKKKRNQGQKASNRQGVDRNKAPRLCYNAERGTLSRDLP